MNMIGRFPAFRLREAPFVEPGADSERIFKDLFA